MKKILISLVLLAGCYDDSENLFVKNKILYDGVPARGCVLFEGDSNTDMIPISGYFPGAYNMAIGGSTTRDVISRIESVRQIAPSMIIVMIGTNDIPRLSGVHKDYMDDDEFILNLQAIMEEYKAITDNVIFVSVLPINREAFGVDLNPKIMSVNTTIKDLCLNNGCYFIDEWEDFFDGNGIKSGYNIDPAHLSPLGQSVHMNNVIKGISRFLAGT